MIHVHKANREKPTGADLMGMTEMRRIVGRTSWLWSARWLYGLLIPVLLACDGGEGAGSTEGEQGREEGPVAAVQAPPEAPAGAVGLEAARDVTLILGGEPVESGGDTGDRVGLHATPDDGGEAPELQETTEPETGPDPGTGVAGGTAPSAAEPPPAAEAAEPEAVARVEPGDAEERAPPQAAPQTTPARTVAPEEDPETGRGDAGETRQGEVQATVGADRIGLAAVDDRFDGVVRGAAEMPLDVLGNDAGEGLTIADVGPPDMGGTIRSDGDRLLYTPPPHFTGTEVFSYRVRDRHGQTRGAVVKVVVGDHRIELASADDLFEGIRKGSAETPLDVLANDAGERLTIADVGPPDMGGTIRSDGDRLLYTPPPHFTGTEVFSYRVRDHHGGTRAAVVKVTVAAAPEPGSLEAAAPEPAVASLESAGSPAGAHFVRVSGRIEITKRLNIRQGRPSTRARWLRTVPVGTVIEVSGWTRGGEEVDGNGYWYQDLDGNYFWAGGTAAAMPQPEADGQVADSAAADRFVQESGRIEITERLNIRQGRPSTRARRLGTMPAGTVVEYSGWTRGGEEVDGNGHWYKDLDGNYFWAGGTAEPTPGREAQVSTGEAGRGSADAEADLAGLVPLKEPAGNRR